jgi:hypothetical protein
MSSHKGGRATRHVQLATQILLLVRQVASSHTQIQKALLPP